MSKKILIVGATSAMAQAMAKLYADEGASFFLTGRNINKLDSVKSDLISRGSKDVCVYEHDVESFQSQSEEIILQADKFLGKIEICLLAYGYLGEQETAVTSLNETQKILLINFLSPAVFLTEMANYFEKRGEGHIACITSVAGDRGRKSNYVYGSAKGGLGFFLQGMRQRLHKKGVHVLTVKPGFVNSPMTSHLNQNFLFADPMVIGQGIKKAISKKSSVVYLPWFWKYILLIIRSIPEKIFQRL